MFNLKDSICIGGSSTKPCEDAIGYGKNYCFVIDGASGLSKINIIDEQSDAAWFATQVKEKLCSTLDEDEWTPTNIILGEIIRELNVVYNRAAESKGLELPSDSPSAGIVLFRKMGEKIVYFGLGDCTGVIQLMDGTVEVLKDTRLCSFDGAVIQEMVKLHEEKGINILEAREECNDLLLANRNKRNKEGGYWILDLSGVGIEHAMNGSWPMNSIKTLFGCSDGFAQLADTFEIYRDYAELLEAAQNTSLLDLCNTLFEEQDKDPQANKFPRFKLRDDTSCLWGIIK